ncbi:MAG: 2-dehydro-3-deoxygalactonokinase [Pseudomonadota bacterium]
MSSPADIKADWLAVDWGTSHLRVWALSASDTVLWKGASEAGMGKLARDAFELALLSLVEPLLGERHLTAVACGMVGSRQGWVEAPYVPVPSEPLGPDLIRAPMSDGRLSVHVVPGLRQTAPADVMRGEETQIAGFLALNKEFDGIMCLPGTHTKWAHVSAGEVVSFKTFMTGELFACLSGHSVLKHSTGGDGWDKNAFLSALSDTLSRPEGLAGALFGIRARHLLDGQNPSVSRAELSGYLIGAELAAARPYWLGQQVAILGADALAEAYGAALAAQGVAATVADAERMTLAGLAAAHRALKETTQ